MSGLLSPELLANIGKTSPPRLELVTRKDIRKYAIATQQRERRFLDGDEAPPMFYLALFWPVPENDQLSPDGVAIDPLLPEFPLKRAMAGGLHTAASIPVMCCRPRASSAPSTRKRALRAR
jgi:hypothetical protein